MVELLVWDVIGVAVRRRRGDRGRRRLFALLLPVGRGRERDERADQNQTDHFYSFHVFSLVFILPDAANYSHRSATIGSTFAALRAGIQQANKATTINNAATTPYVHESVGRTPKSKFSIHRV